MTTWIDILNKQVLSAWNTKLAGGFAEPLYVAAKDSQPAEIRFTQNFERSALHELAHWCVAGESRRQRDDYGYWYAPDGRNNDQQQEFYRVEIKPQAIERHLCAALNIPFDVSVDNLGNTDIQGIEEFRSAVEQEYRRLNEQGLPRRAASIHTCLTTYRGG